MSQDIFETEFNVDPTGDMIVNFIIDKDKEEPYVDFKETISISKDSPFAKIAKDVFAFSNYGGGFMFIGFRDNKNAKSTQEKEHTRNFEPVGVSDDFHLDQADFQVKFNAYSNHPIQLRYREFHS